MKKNRNEVPRISSGNITQLDRDEIFVFGSNLQGHHGGGAAKMAYARFGAKWGVGVGLAGQSYAIPTMHGGPDAIWPYVEQFVAFAKANSHLNFLVTQIGCGIAGYTAKQIAPLFRSAMDVSNIYLPWEFYKLLAKPYIDRCLHFGKTATEAGKDSIAYLVEAYWVQLHFGSMDYLTDITLKYAGDGLADFRANDGVALSMKAALYDRLCHVKPEVTPDDFREWYESIDFTNVNRGADSPKVRPEHLYCPTLMGAIIGDVCGSIYEFNAKKSTRIDLMDRRMDYTDDTIMTIAVADWLLSDRQLSHSGLVETLRRWGRRYPHPMGSYGSRFAIWLQSPDPKPYGSWGNGSAMRASAVGFAFDTMEATLKAARISAEVTHNHHEGIRGAEATAAAIFLARTGHTKAEMRRWLSQKFGYDLSRTCDDIRPTYSFEGSAQATVPQSIIAFLDSKDFEDAIRLTISLGGDADTMGAITGAIAGAYYNAVPFELFEFAMGKLPADIRAVIGSFNDRHRRDVSMRWRNAEIDIEAIQRDIKSGKVIL